MTYPKFTACILYCFSYFFLVDDVFQNFTECFESFLKPQAVMLHTSTSERSLAVLALCPHWLVVLAVEWAQHHALCSICVILAKKIAQKKFCCWLWCLCWPEHLFHSLFEPLYNCQCNTARFVGCIKKLLVQGVSQVFKIVTVGTQQSVKRVGEPCQVTLHPFGMTGKLLLLWERNFPPAVVVALSSSTSLQKS